MTNKILLGLWKPKEGESRKEFAARVARELKAAARKHEAAAAIKNPRKGGPTT